jgi:hypothetical protein
MRACGDAFEKIFLDLRKIMNGAAQSPRFIENGFEINRRLPPTHLRS